MTTLDKFHRHEALDRAHSILVMIDQLLLDHPFVARHAHIAAYIGQASEMLSVACQAIGNQEVEE